MRRTLQTAGAAFRKVAMAGLWMVAMAGLCPARSLDDVILEPIPSGSLEQLENQIHLWQRARDAATYVPADLPSTTTSTRDYRDTPSHHALKKTFLTLVDNQNAWPEYIYAARLNRDKTAYEYLVSSSDVIENHPFEEYELSDGMMAALRYGKPYVSDVTSQYSAAYIPFYANKEATGFVVFVKHSWAPEQREVLLKPGTLEETALFQLIAVARKMTGDDAAIADGTGSVHRRITFSPGTALTIGSGSASTLAFGPNSAALPGAAPAAPVSVETTKLSYGEGRMDGKRSIGGSGHAIQFTRPADYSTLHTLELFGSRYGTPAPPPEDFTVYILDNDRNVLQVLPFPYSEFERGAETWVALDAGGVPVPETFWVAVDFKPTQTKGVYLGFETTGSKSHSMTGTPERGFKDWEPKSDWMIRVDLAK